MAKLGKANIEPVGSFTNTNLMNEIVAYRKVVATNYVLTNPSEIERRLAIPLMISTKLDGELWFLLFDTEWKLVSPTGRVIHGDIEMLQEATAAKLPKDSIFAGELHILGQSRTRIADVTSALAAGEKAKTELIAFKVFDVVTSSEFSAIGTPYTVRYSLISKLPDGKNFGFIPSTPTKTASEVVEMFDQQVQSSGHEGLVARAEDGRSYKIKQTKDLDTAIIGFTEKRDSDGALLIRSLLLGVIQDDGNWVPLTSTGNVGDNEFRKDLLIQLKPLVRKSTYRRTSESSGVMYQLVEPLIVVEIKCLDLQLEDFQGRPIKHPKLSFNTDGWQVSGWTNSASIHNSIVVRVRNDKSATPEDIGWSQVTRILPINSSNDEIKIGKSEVTKRRVWTKEGAGKVDVRKLVIWKTNKEAAGYPAFVVHWTDYSSTRKSPLDREVRLAPSKDEADKIAEAMIVDNIKKGWNEVTN